MSGQAPGPLTILAGLFADLTQGPPKPPPPPKPPMAPHELHTLWTCLSAGALAGCAYVAFFAAALVGKTPAALLAEFVHAPADPPAALVIWLAVVVIACAYLWVGLHNAAEGAHAGLWAFWSAALPVTAVTVLALHAPRGDDGARTVFATSLLAFSMLPPP